MTDPSTTNPNGSDPMTDQKKSYDRPAQGNLAQHAWDELSRVGVLDADSDYEGMLGKAVMDLVETFASQGHSGMSASLVLDLFARVASWETLSSLTNDPDEWIEVGYGIWQNRRSGKHFSEDGGLTGYNVEDRGTPLTFADRG